MEGKPPDQLYLRITTSYYYRPELISYPFDTQALEVLLEHPTLTADQFEVVPMPNSSIEYYTNSSISEEVDEIREIGLSPSIRFPSYDINSLSWEHRVLQGRYPHTTGYVRITLIMTY